MMANGMIAKLVWDGTDEVRIPSEMGTPRSDQMQGTAAERLGELGGRVCYDSLGKGRPSFSDQIITGVNPHTGEQLVEDVEGYHDHIKVVNHGSVWEHHHFTAELAFSEGHLDQIYNWIWSCANRPGVLVMPMTAQEGLRITVNPRSVREWEAWTRNFYDGIDGFPYEDAECLGSILQTLGHKIAPGIIDADDTGTPVIGLTAAEIVEPYDDHEKWISLFMSGSRGFSHEQVRHGDFTAISQRSTRFCDEDNTPWVEHPLITAWRKDAQARGEYLEKSFLGTTMGYLYATEDNARSEYCLDTIPVARAQYRRCVATLKTWLTSRGVDPATAHKQARGAARGYLGNALQTELIFSASVAQWKLMLNQRATRFADAEIREVYAAERECVLEALKTSRYAASFKDYSLSYSPDGIGYVAQCV